jgi:membrane fusion protein, multidrug efflux system
MKNTLYIMRNLGLSFLVTATLLACGGGKDASGDNKAELAQLQKEKAALDAKIADLKKELDKNAPLKIEKTKLVTVAPLSAGTFEHFVEGAGRLEAENNVFVSPQTGGAIVKMHVKIGDMVAKGQRIATLDNSILTNTIQEVQIQLETAKTIYDRQKALWDQKIGTEVQYIQAKAGVESLERRITTLKSQGAMSIVVSPISGMVDEVRFKEGEMAAPGIGIVRVVNLNNLKVVANIADTYAGTISKGARISVTLPDLGKDISTQISYVSQTINPISRTFAVEGKIPYTDKSLKPNLNAKIKINDKTRTGAIVILQNLIQNTEDGQIVYVAVDEAGKKMAKARKVSLGQSYNGRVEVLSGLASGDLLITDGYQEVVDGQLISY